MIKSGSHSHNFLSSNDGIQPFRRKTTAEITESLNVLDKKINEHFSNINFSQYTYDCGSDICSCCVVSEDEGEKLVYKEDHELLSTVLGSIIGIALVSVMVWLFIWGVNTVSPKQIIKLQHISTLEYITNSLSCIWNKISRFLIFW